MKRKIVRSSWLAVLATASFACGSTSVTDSLPAEHFALVSGVRLHYIDWGGRGECLIFLTPLGGDLIEQFGSLAPRFTDRFRVLGQQAVFVPVMREFLLRQ
jgi:hypothetical protein